MVPAAGPAAGRHRADGRAVHRPGLGGGRSDRCGPLPEGDRMSAATTDRPVPVFDDNHYAATPARKMRRALELGPKYYFWDLPRYFAHRRSLRLPLWDWAAFVNPLREFRPHQSDADSLPPGYEE